MPSRCFTEQKVNHAIGECWSQQNHQPQNLMTVTGNWAVFCFVSVRSTICHNPREIIASWVFSPRRELFLNAQRLEDHLWAGIGTQVSSQIVQRNHNQTDFDARRFQFRQARENFEVYSMSSTETAVLWSVPVFGQVNFTDHVCKMCTVKAQRCLDAVIRARLIPPPHPQNQAEAALCWGHVHA